MGWSASEHTNALRKVAVVVLLQPSRFRKSSRLMLADVCKIVPTVTSCAEAYLFG